MRYKERKRWGMIKFTIELKQLNPNITGKSTVEMAVDLKTERPTTAEGAFAILMKEIIIECYETLSSTDEGNKLVQDCIDHHLKPEKKEVDREGE
jgi:hypothetical protein